MTKSRNEKEARELRNLGTNIYNARNNINMSQETLAEKADLKDKRIIYYYESGQRTPSVKTLLLIKEALNVSFDSLFM